VTVVAVAWEIGNLGMQMAHKGRAATENVASISARRASPAQGKIAGRSGRGRPDGRGL
jgi:hypothetical protein